MRGNAYSYEHVSLDSTKDAGYWDHSWTEFGRYDIPAFIDYIYNYTNCKAEGRKLTFIGYSLGGTATLYGMAKMPEYFRDHLNLFIGFAPGARCSGQTRT